MAEITNTNDKLLAAALRRREILALRECFDPVDPDSRPTYEQGRVISDFGTVKTQWIVAANQCLVVGTLVQTPRGPIPIESIRVGDTVYSEYGRPIKVLNVYQNGIREVADLTYRGKVWASSTADHVFQVVTGRGRFKQVRASELTRDMSIRRVWVRPELGSKTVTDAYAIGALLGDGCSRQNGKRVQISSIDDRIPRYVAGLYGNTAVSLHESNYTWSVGYLESEYYDKWCKGRYAHQKVVDIEELSTWNRESLIQFIAGLIDTDGTVYPSRDYVTLSLDMQAKSVVDAMEWAVHRLWGITLNRSVDNRSKYKNGPIHSAYTRNVVYINEIMDELDQYILSPQKKWKSEYLELGGSRTNRDSVGASWGFNKRMEETYDIHVDSPTNLYLLSNGLVTHNSGKSQTCSRILAWFITETHPTWKRPVEWGEEPLLAVIIGKSSKILEESIWPKIRSYLEAGTYKEVKQGNALQKVEFPNGARIVFQSAENPNQAAERIQSYVAHFVWIDEMPPTIKVVTEAMTRRNSRGGYFMASFTPLVVNRDIQKLVDNAPANQRYRFRMFDNPVYSSPARQAEVLEGYATLPEDVRNARLYGDWTQPDNNVFFFDYDTMVEMPVGYSPLWRHVEVVDPATSSALGLTVWAENPDTKIWYCVVDDYIRGIHVPTEIVRTVQERVRGFNIIKRIADPEATWYINQAAAMGTSYGVVYKANGRKAELIKGLQQVLGSRVRFAPHCTRLIAEIQEARWSDQVEGKIVNGSRFHLSDTAQYFADGIPKADNTPVFRTQQEYLYQANEKRKQVIEQARLRTQKQAIRRGRRTGTGGFLWNSR